MEAYSCLANSGVSIMVTSDVFLDQQSCSHPFALSLDREHFGFVAKKHLQAYRSLANACKSSDNSCMSLMQISHAGPYAPRAVTNAPLTPGFSEQVDYDGCSTFTPLAPEARFSCLPTFLQPLCVPRYALTEEIG
jgi:2,4-dienoyl-CoA reductase-like NADH-dependent reductase (Old Yellow Enzyme family)